MCPRGADSTSVSFIGMKTGRKEVRKKRREQRRGDAAAAEIRSQETDFHEKQCMTRKAADEKKGVNESE